MTPECNKLNLGCGLQKIEGFWNIDIEPKVNPDQVLDIETTPWPFEDDFFEKINATSILEYVGENPKIFLNIIKEMYRVSKDKCEWFVRIPHPNNSVVHDDPFIVNLFTTKTIEYFDQKKNKQFINQGMSFPQLGLDNKIDLELFEVKYNLEEFWMKQLQDQMVGSNKMGENLFKYNNICQNVEMFIRVHKPGRFESM